MRALLEQVHSRSPRRGQLSVYQFQKTYALWLGLVLFIYSVLLFGFAFAAPFRPPGAQARGAPAAGGAACPAGGQRRALATLGRGVEGERAP